MGESNNELISRVAEYYSAKIQQHGDTPAGVDWNGVESQELRFSQLSKVLPNDLNRSFSLADLGCGYGAYFDHLSSRSKISYTGYDVSHEMCLASEKRLREFKNVTIRESATITEPVDFSVASGIFNVAQGAEEGKWREYVVSILSNMNTFSKKGFAFNCLTSYSDESKMRDYLYYASPEELFGLCKRDYARNVVLLHDYDLYEFTILVRKND